jgi:hypothetical protein
LFWRYHQNQKDSIFKNGDEWSRFDEPKNLLLKKVKNRPHFSKCGPELFANFFDFF